ncbi:MAG: archaemetzincin family Zn-dependent metalloprotease [Bacteroidetes bacterium]|nr:archaemetzincin family Zn-dependent metalloprotease [Bacteroidota bacterium]
MKLQKITLISFGYFDHDFLQNIAKKIHDEFFITAQVKEAYFDLSDFYDPARRQYDANQLLHYIEKNYSADDAKTIGLFNVDLFIPIFTYIFGQAFLNGRTGIASAYRLSNERYGIDADAELMQERFAKEIIHELGHTFGLKHCHVSDCIMRSGTYVEDIDQKNSGFCQTCNDNLLI